MVKQPVPILPLSPPGPQAGPVQNQSPFSLPSLLPEHTDAERRQMEQPTDGSGKLEPNQQRPLLKTHRAEPESR